MLIALLINIREGKIKAGEIFAYDANAQLIGFYNNVKNHPNELYAEVLTHFERYKLNPEQYYYEMRTAYNLVNDANSIACSALFLMLNKTGFRGLYRVGPRGYNVPFGHYKNPGVVDLSHLLEISALFQDVVFIHADFSASMANIKQHDFVYLDPPYIATDFVGYTSGGFNGHTELFALCKEMPASFVMSNAPAAAAAFPGPKYTIQTINCRRRINSRNPTATANEIIISHLTNHF